MPEVLLEGSGYPISTTVSLGAQEKEERGPAGILRQMGEVRRQVWGRVSGTWRGVLFKFSEAEGYRGVAIEDKVSLKE